MPTNTITFNFPFLCEPYSNDPVKKTNTDAFIQGKFTPEGVDNVPTNSEKGAGTTNVNKLPAEQLSAEQRGKVTDIATEAAEARKVVGASAAGNEGMGDTVDEVAAHAAAGSAIVNTHEPVAAGAASAV
ncbi:hypothetical protein FRB95_013026 [Tulasnella sp. JGI-2019a]|nr:hypothetical protein FRB95_013026 [Tulasnella sp. JGI-2019a]